MKRMFAVLAVLAGVVLWAPPSAAEDTYIGARVTTLQLVGGRGADGGAAPVTLDSAGRMTTATTASSPTCSALAIKATSCGTTPLAVPVSRAAGSTSVEVVVSPENAGAPKVKCTVDPADGGVGFGGTNPGVVGVVGYPLVFPLDSTHTIICVCDTAGTALVSSECTP